MEADLGNFLNPLLIIVLFIFLIAFSTYNYMKLRRWIVMLVIFLSSCIFAVVSLNMPNIPLNMFLQTFFILIQLVFFIMISIEAFTKEPMDDD